MKRIFSLFIIALVLNMVWENLHSFLYESYRGGSITEFILVRASLFDALIIVIILVPFLYVSFLRKRTWLIVVIGTIVAIMNEWYGLSTGRWLYSPYMPIVPMLEVGLTPMLQLGLLGYLSFQIQGYLSSEHGTIGS